MGRSNSQLNSDPQQGSDHQSQGAMTAEINAKEDTSDVGKETIGTLQQDPIEDPAGRSPSGM